MLAVAHGNSDNGDGLLSAVRDRTAERTGHDGTVQLNLQLGADRLNSAVEASRLSSYDPELQKAWDQYCRDDGYPPPYRRVSTLLNRLYQSDSRFLYGVFCFADDPENRNTTVVNGSSGLLYHQARELWQTDASPILAMELDTTVGFWVQDGRLYLVRNLMDSSYDRIGTLSLVLDTDYFFGDLALLPWVSAVSVSLAPQAALTLKGEIPFQPRERILEHTIRDRDYTLYGTAAWDYAALSTGAKSYRYFDRGAGCPVLQHSQPGLQASG